MKAPALTFGVLLAISVMALGAVATTDVQAELKSQGFYFGTLDGKAGPEYSAALRRYQIRNGLEVTGEVNDETLGALGLGANAPAPAPTEPVPPTTPNTIAPEPATVAPQAPVNLRREESIREADARELQREEERAARETPVRRTPLPPPAPLNVDPAPREGLSRYYAGTPYATAPASVQVDTLRRAQSLLASRGWYTAAVDGDPGPATEEALILFQDSAQLPRTGRLDLETLNALRLLPGRSRMAPVREAPERQGGFQRPSSVQRGVRVWVE